jgi:hypothetical protein
MNRKKIITRLMKEGLTEKTLVNMNDKQLGILAERMLSEQYSTYTASSAATTPSANSPSIINIPKTDQTSINAAKQQKKIFATYEGEMKEDLKLGAEKKDYSDKEKAIKGAEAKIRAAIKDGKEYGDYTRLIKKLNDGKLPESTEKIISNKDKNLKEWVNKIVEKNVHPFTSKGEIMELINIKLTEQTKLWKDDDDVDVMEPSASQGSPQTAPRPKETEVDPDVIPARPKTEPGVDPDDPFRDPHPGIDPGPKAREKQHISAKEAKDKIIDLMKKMLR